MTPLTRVGPVHDLRHRPVDGGRMRDSLFWQTVLPGARLALQVYVFVTGTGAAGYNVAVWGRDGVVALERGGGRVPTEMDFDDFTVGGITVRNDGALRSSSVSVRGDSLAVDLAFDGLHDAFSFRDNPDGLPSWFADDRIEQTGRVSGTVTIDGVAQELGPLGHRDHSWGVRDWRAPQHWKWFVAYAPMGGAGPTAEVGGTAGVSATGVVASGSGGTTGDGAAEVGAAGVGASEVGASEVGASDVGAAEVGASGVGATQVGASGVGATQVGASGVGATQVGAARVGAAGVGGAGAGGTTGWTAVNGWIWQARGDQGVAGYVTRDGRVVPVARIEQHTDYSEAMEQRRLVATLHDVEGGETRVELDVFGILPLPDERSGTMILEGGATATIDGVPAVGQFEAEWPLDYFAHLTGDAP